MSPRQLANLRERAAISVERVFETTITISGVSMKAARWKASSGFDNELAGLLPSADMTLRLRRSVIPQNICITPKRTILSESGKEYRVDQIFDSNGDPALVLLCKAL